MQNHAKRKPKRGRQGLTRSKMNEGNENKEAIEKLGLQNLKVLSQLRGRSTGRRRRIPLNHEKARPLVTQDVEIEDGTAHRARSINAFALVAVNDSDSNTDTESDDDSIRQSSLRGAWISGPPLSATSKEIDSPRYHQVRALSSWADEVSDDET